MAVCDKKYAASKKLTADQLKIVNEAFRLSPSSFGIQSWKFIRVKDPAMPMKLSEAETRLFSVIPAKVGSVSMVHFQNEFPWLK